MRKFTLPALVLTVSSWSAWTPISQPLPGSISHAFKLPSGLMAWVYGKPYLSTDDGGSWTLTDGGLPKGVILFKGVSRGDTVVAYGSGTIWRTSNAGQTWSEWAEGFVDPTDAVWYSYMPAGDTTYVLSLHTRAGAITWKRNPGSKWVRIKGSDQPETGEQVVWVGNAFASYDGDSVLVLDPSDSVWKKSSTLPKPEATARFQGAYWLASGTSVSRSSDSGRTWQTMYPSTKWISEFASTSTALVGIGADSMILLNPTWAIPDRRQKQPEPYGWDLVELGKRWMFLGENATWVSDDMGMHWTRGGIAGKGLLGEMLPTPDGVVMQDQAIRSQGWISTDLQTWTPFALPETVRRDAIDTAAGILYAMDYKGLWTRNGTTWVRDSMGGDGYSEFAPSVAWDGSRLWCTDTKRLYATSLQPKAWKSVDSGLQMLGVTVIRSWNNALWLGGQVGSNGSKILGKRSANGTWTYPELRGERVTAMAPTSKALWIGTDSGLFRTTAGTSYEEWPLGPRTRGGHVMGLAAKGDTIAVSMIDKYPLTDFGPQIVYLSLDGGDTWDEQKGVVAPYFHIGPDRIAAMSYRGGLDIWGATNGIPSGSVRLDPAFRWRPGRLEWNLSGAQTLEIIDARGRILSSIDVAPGTFGISLEPSASLRIARLKSPTATRTLAIPPLR